MENPKIRFKGFTKDWEQRKLSEITTMHARIGWQNLRTSEFLDSGDYMLITGTDFNDGAINYSTCHFVERERYEQDKHIQIKNGSILITKDGTLGKVAYVQGLSMPATLNAGVFNVEIKDETEVNDKYLFQYLKAPFLMDYVNKKATGGTIKHLNQNILVDFPVFMPSKAEQEEIGTYFEKLDNLITLHQRKCEQTKKLKKYMLQKMFPQNGAKVPEIRFDGFTYDWEQRKLSDVLDIVTKRNGEKYGKEEVLSVSDEYGCINQIKFQGRSFAGEDISNYKIVDTGDIIYTRSPLKSKPYGIIKVVGDEIGIVSPLYIVNKVKEGNNSQFIYRVFDSPEKTNKYLSPLVRKGAKNTMNISNDEWLSGKIDVAPSYEEQYQIGLYFDHLDHLITLHQRKCDELRKMKKYMLQNMFI